MSTEELDLSGQGRSSYDRGITNGPTLSSMTRRYPIEPNIPKVDPSLHSRTDKAFSKHRRVLSNRKQANYIKKNMQSVDLNSQESFRLVWRQIPVGQKAEIGLNDLLGIPVPEAKLQQSMHKLSPSKIEQYEFTKELSRPHSPLRCSRVDCLENTRSSFQMQATGSNGIKKIKVKTNSVSPTKLSKPQSSKDITTDAFNSLSPSIKAEKRFVDSFVRKPENSSCDEKVVVIKRPMTARVLVENSPAEDLNKSSNAIRVENCFGSISPESNKKLRRTGSYSINITKKSSLNERSSRPNSPTKDRESVTRIQQSLRTMPRPSSTMLTAPLLNKHNKFRLIDRRTQEFSEPLLAELNKNNSRLHIIKNFYNKLYHSHEKVNAPEIIRKPAGCLLTVEETKREILRKSETLDMPTEPNLFQSKTVITDPKNNKNIKRDIKRLGQKIDFTDKNLNTLFSRSSMILTKKEIDVIVEQQGVELQREAHEHIRRRKPRLKIKDPILMAMHEIKSKYDPEYTKPPKLDLSKGFFNKEIEHQLFGNQPDSAINIIKDMDQIRQALESEHQTILGTAVEVDKETEEWRRKIEEDKRARRAANQPAPRREIKAPLAGKYLE